MNISKAEQRVLHVLAQGGHIRHLREEKGTRKITQVICFTRDGSALAGFNVKLFRRLKRRRLISSSGGAPYQITYLGRVAVRPQLDNR